jgi:2'-5' RNA ligase
MKRLFLGIPLSADPWKGLLADLQDRMPDPRIQWTRPENLHVTILFLGNVAEKNIPALTRAIGECLQRTPPFQLQWERLAIRRHREQPIMIWGFFQPSIHFTTLVNNIKISLSSMVNMKPKHSPLPHVTLARLRRGVRMPPLPSPNLSKETSLSVHQAVLYESRPSRHGSQYDPIATFAGKKSFRPH